MEPLYKQIFVWTRVNKTLALRFACFENLETHKFHVKSCDYLQLPVNDETLRTQTYYLLDFFIEFGLAERKDWHSSLEEAIDAFSL